MNIKRLIGHRTIQGYAYKQMRPLPSENHRANIDGSAFERLVFEYIGELGKSLPGFRVEHREVVTAPDGQYQIDVTARFEQIGVDF